MLERKAFNPGDPVKASDFTNLWGAVADIQAPSSPTSSATMRQGPERIVCSAYNSGTVNINPFEAIVIVGQGGTPGLESALVAVRHYAGQDQTNGLAVALDFMKPGEAGRVCVAGVIWGLWEGGTGAYAYPGARGLIASSSGPAQVLAWRGSYLLIRFPVGGGSSTLSAVPLHTHQGFYDGGWAGFLSGSK